METKPCSRILSKQLGYFWLKGISARLSYSFTNFFINVNRLALKSKKLLVLCRKIKKYIIGVNNIDPKWRRKRWWWWKVPVNENSRARLLCSWPSYKIGSRVGGVGSWINKSPGDKKKGKDKDKEGKDKDKDNKEENDFYPNSVKSLFYSHIYKSVR